MNKSIKEIVYTDFPLIKEITMNGEIKVYENNKALMQAVKIWLSSSNGEKIRSRDGGCLIRFLGKVMDENTIGEMERVIRNSLETEFSPNLTVDTLKVIADKTRNRWIIYIVAFSIELQIGINDYVIVSNT